MSITLFWVSSLWYNSVHVHVRVQVVRQHVHTYEPGRIIPHCTLIAKISPKREKIPDLECCIKLIGAKRPFDVFMIDLTHSPACKWPQKNPCILIILFVEHDRLWSAHINWKWGFETTIFHYYWVRYELSQVPLHNLQCSINSGPSTKRPRPGSESDDLTQVHPVSKQEGSY